MGKNGNGDQWARFDHEDGENHRRNGFTRFLWLLGLLAGAAFVLFIVVSVSRMHPETLALITGAVMVGAPLIAVVLLLLLIILRLLAAVVKKQSNGTPPQQMMMPPIIMQMPAAPQQPALPHYVEGEYTYTPGNGGRRGWEVIGDDE